MDYKDPENYITSILYNAERATGSYGYKAAGYYLDSHHKERIVNSIKTLSQDSIETQGFVLQELNAGLSNYDGRFAQDVIRRCIYAIQQSDTQLIDNILTGQEFIDLCQQLRDSEAASRL